MAVKYYNRQENAVPFQEGLSFKAGMPADDRLVLDYSDLYISEESPTDATLYNKAYTGMIVTVFESDGKPTILVLKNADPYSAGSISTINSANLREHWFSPSSDSIEGDISDLNRRVGIIDTSIANLTKVDASLNASIASHNASIVNLNTSISKVNASLNASIVSANASIVNLNTSISKVNASLNASIVSANASISKLDTSVKAVATSVDTLRNNVSTLVTQTVTAINASIANVSSYVQSVNASTSSAINLLRQYDSSNFVYLETLINENKRLVDSSIQVLDSSCSELFEIIFNNELVTAEALIELNNKINRTMASYVAIESEDYPYADLCIADASNKVIVAFEDGHIKTQNFDSSAVNASIERLFQLINS